MDKGSLGLGVESFSNNENLKKSFGVDDLVKSVDQNDDLEKAFDVGSVFSSYDEQFKFTKTGKSIKEKLVVVKASEVAEIQACITKMTQYQAKIGVVPVGMLSDYTVNKYKHRLKWLPNVYTYEQKYGDGENKTPTAMDTLTPEAGVSKYVIPSEHKQCSNDYNDLARKVGKLLISMVQLDTLANNLSDSKSYKLSAEQLTLLGF